VIFNAVIKFYSQGLSQIEKILLKDDNAIENMETYLNVILISTKETNGCLLYKTLLVLSPNDKKLQDSINNFLLKVEKLLEKNLCILKKNSNNKIDPKTFSKFIISTIYGAHVYYKVNNDDEMLQESIRIIMSILRRK